MFGLSILVSSLNDGCHRLAVLTPGGSLIRNVGLIVGLITEEVSVV